MPHFPWPVSTFLELLPYPLLVFGIYLLLRGADYLVEGASSIAREFNVSNLVIGLTIVAFGTSTPELVVSVISAAKGSTGLAMGNVLGSNIANTLLILGAAAAIRPLLIRSNTVRLELPFSVLAIVAVGFLANDALIDGEPWATANVLTRSDGLVLLSFFTIFLYYTFVVARQGVEQELEGATVRRLGFFRASVLVVLGLLLLTLGGYCIVENAKSIALSHGMDERLIGLTIVAIGTSLPELAAAVVAARRNKADLVVGGVIGSNVFNLLWILGVTAPIRPLPFEAGSLADIYVNIAASVAVFLAVLFGRGRLVDRWEGATLVVFYFAYIGYTVAVALRGAGR